MFIRKWSSQEKLRTGVLRSHAGLIMIIFTIVGLSALISGVVMSSRSLRSPSAGIETDPSAVSIPASASIPSSASPVIDASFPAFAFEDTSMFMYAGSPGQPNAFSVNLLQGITSRTNTKPSIRVGGTSLDRARYVASQQAAVAFPSGQVGNVPASVTLGPTYFDSFPNFADALYTLCLPLAANNLSNTVEMAQVAYPVIKNQLEMLEIGNEPNSYAGTVRPSSYTQQQYVFEFNQYTGAVSSALGLTSNDPIYQAVTLGSPDLYQDSDSPASPGLFYPNTLFEGDLANVAPRIKAVSMHYYQTLANYGATPQLQEELMNHTITVDKMTFFESAIDYFAAHYPHIRVSLAEAASSLNGATNDYDFESTFGAALWQVDWMLWCMNIGFYRVAWQQISASAYNLWQPVAYKNRAPAVLPPYYAMLFAADFIGTSGDTRVANIDLHSDVFSAYAAYSSSHAYSGIKLTRIAIVNLAYWSGAGARPSQTFQISFPAGVSSANVMRLDCSGGAAASAGITWGGQEWTFAGNGQAQNVKKDNFTIAVSRGSGTVTVHSSQAVMIMPNY